MFKEYLEESSIINYSDREIQKLIYRIRSNSKDNIDYIKNAFEFVRDRISHSADIENKRKITCRASDVLKYKEGICFAKSHLLAALLRGNGVPSGFSYQRVILNDETEPYLVLHGLNTIYIEEVNKWIRLDARGSRDGAKSEFSIITEKLTFPIRWQLGEEELKGNFSKPNSNVIWALNKYKSFDELWSNLPRA